MAKSKKVTIDFWQARVDDEIRSLGEVFEALRGAAPAQRIGTMYFEVRRLSLHRRCYRGELAKIRQDDIPHAGAPGGVERDLALAEHEGLVEKNFFHYHADRNVLVYQRNGNGSASARLGQYLGLCAERRVAFDPVLQLEPMRRLMRGGVRVRVADVRVATPQNPDMYANETINHHLMKVLQGTGAYGFQMIAKAAPLSVADPARVFLHDRVRSAVAELVRENAVDRAVLDIEDADNVRSSIDLIKDRMVVVKPVEKPGRYFDPVGMHAALQEAFDDRREQLDELFGDGIGGLV